MSCAIANALVRFGEWWVLMSDTAITMNDEQFALLQLASNVQYYQDSFLIQTRGGGGDLPTAAVPKKMKEILGRRMMTASVVDRQSFLDS